MDIFCTDFSGLIRWIPSPSVSPVTLPNSVRIPTLPVGIETTLQKNRITTRIKPVSRKIFDPNPPKFGIAGRLLPKSKLFVVPVIVLSVLKLVGYPSMGLRADFLVCGESESQVLNACAEMVQRRADSSPCLHGSLPEAYLWMAPTLSLYYVSAAGFLSSSLRVPNQQQSTNVSIFSTVL